MTSRKFHNNTVDINHIWYKSHKDLIKAVANELDCKDKVEELIEKFLGTQLKIKKFKDPNEPKKPKTGFQHFCDEFRPKIVKKNPDFKLGDIMKELGKLWGSYTEEQKEKYNEMYNDAKCVYEEQLEQYNESLY